MSWQKRCMITTTPQCQTSSFSELWSTHSLPAIFCYNYGNTRLGQYHRVTGCRRRINIIRSDSIASTRTSLTRSGTARNRQQRGIRALSGAVMKLVGAALQSEKTQYVGSTQKRVLLSQTNQFAGVARFKQQVRSQCRPAHFGCA